MERGVFGGVKEGRITFGTNQGDPALFCAFPPPPLPDFWPPLIEEQGRGVHLKFSYRFNK